MSLLSGFEFYNNCDKNDIFVLMSDRQDKYKVGLNNFKNFNEKDGLNFVEIKNSYKYIYQKFDIFTHYRIVNIPIGANIYSKKDRFIADKLILSEKNWIYNLPSWNDMNYCINAVNYKKELFVFTKNQNHQMCIDAVKFDGDLLKYVINQTNEICREAIQNYGFAFRYVKEKTVDLCLEAVNKNGCTLCYIKEQTPEICLAAVSNDGLSLRHVIEQTYEISKKAIENDSRAIQFVKNQTIELCELSLKMKGFNYTHIKNKTPELAKLALTQDGSLLYDIKNPTEEMYLIALKQKGNSLRYVTNQNENLCSIAINQNGFSIKYVKDKQLQAKLLDCALNNIKSKYEIYSLFIQEYLKVIMKSSDEQRQWIFEKNSLNDLRHIIKLQQNLRDEIFFDICDDKEFDKLYSFFEYYNINYSEKSFQVSIQVNSFDPKLQDLIDILVFQDIDLLFNFILGNIESIKKESIKFMLENNFNNIFQYLEKQKGRIIYHNYKDDEINNDYTIRNKYIDGNLNSEKVIFKNNISFSFDLFNSFLEERIKL